MKVEPGLGGFLWDTLDEEGTWMRRIIT